MTTSHSAFRGSAAAATAVYAGTPAKRQRPEEGAERENPGYDEREGADGGHRTRRETQEREQENEKENDVGEDEDGEDDDDEEVDFECLVGLIDRFE